MENVLKAMGHRYVEALKNVHGKVYKVEIGAKSGKNYFNFFFFSDLFFLFFYFSKKVQFQELLTIMDMKMERCTLKLSSYVIQVILF